jgi:hypothetical protein
MRPFARSFVLVLGFLLIALALLTSSGSLEAFFGRQSGSLTWGPVLFRILLAAHGMVLLAAARMHAPAEQPEAWEPIRRGTLAVLAGLSVLAIALRIPGLNSCMWLDEILTMARFARPPVSHILTTFPDQNQHMLYSLMAHGVMSIFGDHVWALRLPSVFFGVASIWALFLFGRRLLGEREVLLACALMTVSYHHIWFSQNARGYMGLLFFTLLASWLWLEALERDRWGVWLGYAAAIALGMWIHMTILFVAAVQALISLIIWVRSSRDPLRLSRMAAAFLLSGTFTLQLYALSLPEFLRTGVSEFSPPSDWTNPLWVVRESLRSLQTGFAALAVVFCGGLMIAAGWFSLLRRKPAAAWVMVLPGILGGGLMLALGHNLWPRFFFFCMGFALLIAVHGAIEMPRLIGRLLPIPGSWAERAGYALAGLMIVASATTVPRCYALPKQDFTGARAYVERELRPGDTVVVAGLAEHAYGSYYAPSWKIVNNADELSAVRATASRTFVVYTLPIELRAVHPDIWKTLETEFTTDRVFYGTLGGGEVYVCRSENTRRQALLQ